MNQTITEFMIVGFSRLESSRHFIFVMLLIVYLLIISGNITIVLVIWIDPQLHTPMYTFAGMLSFLDICYTAVTIPQILMIFWIGQVYVAVSSCLLQMYFFFSFLGNY
ncbi:unnamed protein product [Staurois parvus]|uniref:G-protein coupled receptors family 1 profile domain-containing protein n=1 Tax=Staurois parvus TaxID=386267 RepID=A0ABN9BIC2_9NEOB|nr:unnamed protein product [Staurois parvus]